MALSVTVSQVKKVAATNRIYVKFADGRELEFKNLQEAKDWAMEADSDPFLARDALSKVFARWYFLRDPSGTNPALIEGHTMTLDLNGATLLTVT